MPPNKTKRTTEDSPEERRSKRKKLNEDEDEEEKEREPISKAPSKKTPICGGSQKPAELFRKDLISAMKLADSEPLAAEDYLLIADSWRQEWERGVQVPVNEISIPRSDLREACEKPTAAGDFKIPKKFLHSQKDEIYQLGIHELTGMQQLSEQVVRYDLDDLDVSWLRLLNEEREEVGEDLIYEWTMERVIEALESKCHENMEIKKKTEEGLGIEYDEDIVCEICRSPDSEDSNEMVFCDGCDICVHQACYGIQTVPEGSWLCRTCALGIKPACILCPKVGGAMKSTRSGTKWAHVSCAIWIPEVTIGCVEKMEPITKISQIPASRWALICVMCKERCGACIQCSVKACKTAFHVTCAFSEKLEMKTVLVEEKNSEDVKLKAYCPKHSKKRDRNSNSESESDSPRKSIGGTPVKEKEMSEEEMARFRAERLHKLEEEFYTLVKVSEVAIELQIPEEVVDLIYVFWKLKRKSLFNRPLLTPKTEEADLLEKQQEDSLLARMKMFVHLRQDLERVRNLSYMISKREKMKRQFNTSRESVFYAALELLTDKKLNLSTREVEKVVKQYRDLPPPYSGKPNKKEKSPFHIAKSKIVPAVNPMVRTIENDDTDSKPAQTITSSESEVIMIEPGTSELKDEIFPSKCDIKTENKEIKTGKKAIIDTPKSRKSKLKIVKKDEKVGKDVSTEQPICVDDDDTSAMEVDVTGGRDSVPVVSTGRHSMGTGTDDKHTEQKSLIKKRGRPPKKSISNVKSDLGSKGSGVSGNNCETSECLKDDKEKVAADRKSRKRSSLVTSDKIVVKDEPVSPVGRETREKSIDKRDSVSVTSENISVKEKKTTSVKLTEIEKQRLISEVPSAKNVSDHMKAEINGLFKSNKLLVSSRLRHKIQHSLLNSKRNRLRSNGVVIDHSQKKIDSFFMKSPPHSDSDTHQDQVKNMSRVLNELSPTRDGMEANNVDRLSGLKSVVRACDFQMTCPTRTTPSRQSAREKSVENSTSREGSPDTRFSRRKSENSSVSSRERLFDVEKGIVTPSRESTPESWQGSSKSFSSFKHDSDRSRVQTRSATPVLVNKDPDDSILDENICDESKRQTRSGNEERCGSMSPRSVLTRAGSMSPRTVHRSQVNSVT